MSSGKEDDIEVVPRVFLTADYLCKTMRSEQVVWEERDSPWLEDECATAGAMLLQRLYARRLLGKQTTDGSAVVIYHDWDGGGKRKRIVDDRLQGRASLPSARTFHIGGNIKII